MKKSLIVLLCFYCIFLVACRDKKIQISLETKELTEKFLKYDIVPDISSILKTKSNRIKLEKANLKNFEMSNIPKDYIDILPQLEEIQLISETAALEGMNMLHRELPEIPVANTWVEYDNYFHAINKRYSRLSYTDNSVTYANYLDMDYGDFTKSGSYRFYYISVVDDGNDEIIYYHSIIHDVSSDYSYHFETNYKYIKGKLFFYHQMFNNGFSDLVICNENIEGEDIVYGYSNSGRINETHESVLDFSIYGNEHKGYFVYGNDNDSYFYKDGYRLLKKKWHQIGAHINLLNIQITNYLPKHFILHNHDINHTYATLHKIKINEYVLNDKVGTDYYNFEDYNYIFTINEQFKRHDLDNLLTYFQDDKQDLFINFLDNYEDFQFKSIKMFWPEFDQYQTNRNDYKNWFSNNFLTENFMTNEEIKMIPHLEDKVFAVDYDLSNIILIDSSLYEVDTLIIGNNVTITMLHSRHNKDDLSHQHFLNGKFRKVVALMDVSNEKIYPLIETDPNEFFSDKYIISITLDEFKNRFTSIPDGKYLSVIYYEKENNNDWEIYGQIYSHDWTQIIKNEVLLYWNNNEITKMIKQDIASSIPNIYYKHITISSIDD